MSEAERDDGDIDDPGGEPPRAVLASVELFPAYVRGFPVHAAITIGAEPPGATLSLLPRPTLFSTANSVGFVLRDGASGLVRVEVIPRPRITQEPGAGGFTLASGQVYRTLVDLAPLLPLTLPADRYRISLVYVSGFGEHESDPLPFVLGEPTPEEREILDSMRPGLPRGATWSALARQPAADPESLRGPFSGQDPLVYLRVLRWLLRGEDDLADIDPAVLDVLAGPYAPEADVLRAELARARGDVAAYDAIEERVLATHPGLAARMGAVRDGDSEIQRENEARRERRRRRS